jgi:hypothetical protein
MDETQDEAPFDPTRRKLCPDGSCVGVIGDDGRCRVCGRTEEQAAAGEEAPEASGLEASGLEASGLEGSEDGAGAEGATAGGGGFNSKRRLCADGACVGVVGDDGVCRVCGRRSE